MIEPLKPLTDSGLAVFLLSVSNKTAPKWQKNAPIFGRGNRQNKILIFSQSLRQVAKVGIFFETTKKPHDGGSLGLVGAGTSLYQSNAFAQGLGDA